MTRTHKKKSRKKQANRTRGYGKTGAHRAKGQKGGTGLTAGKFKHKWTYYMKMKRDGFPGPDGDKWRIGKKGFTLPQKIRRIHKVNAINIKDLELNLNKWMKKDKIKKEDDTYIIDLDSLNFNKLLGNGHITKKMDISVKKASKGAVKKMKEFKGAKLSLNSNE